MLIWSIQYAQYTQLGIIVQVNNVGDGDCGGDGDDDEDDEQYMYSPMHDCDSDGDADEDWGKTNECDEEAYDGDTNDNCED